jgi:phospholipid/cholesterol/gamma-HCH transport system permease protein
MPAPQLNASDEALVELRMQDDALIVALMGDWSLERSQPRFDALVREAQIDLANVRRLAFDADELGAWDTSLLIFLVQCQDVCDEHQLEFDTAGLPEQVPRLLALAHAVPERVQDEPARRKSFLARLGSVGIRVRNEFVAAVTFSGEVIIALAGLVTRRVHMRWRDFWVVVQDNSSGALPIVTLIAVLVGVIIAFLGVVVLARFGAGYYVSYLVGFGMLRELGALMTGIIIAGRTGAAFAAELGSMKITEEVDALTTLGIAPVEHLVLPRLLGLFVMMPLLTIYADFIGIAGGLGVSVLLLDLSLKQFLNGLLAAVTLPDALLGVFKGTLFGFIVGIAGCMKGLQAGSDARAVGRAATSAVVLGITGIIAANAVVDWLAALLDV